MKLVTFKTPNRHEVDFGLFMHDRVISFRDLCAFFNQPPEFLATVLDYLGHIPQSENKAKDLENSAHYGWEKMPENIKYRVDQIQILPCVPEPALLLDFALSPRHIKNAMRTLVKYRYRGFKRWLMEKILFSNIQKKEKARMLTYYKGNHHTISGPDDRISKPAYTHQIDIEPELAFVTSSVPGHIAGYTIFNDWSARDVQMDEMIGLGPAKTKDFSGGNALGPFLVTPDEIADPLSLKVTVAIGNRYQWQGDTSHYFAGPLEIETFIRTIFEPKAGTVVGLGTVPGCSGVEHDKWPESGDQITIEFEKLGTLVQTLD